MALQTSIAKHLAQRQIERLSGDGDSVKTDHVRPEKPTASVQPVVQGSEQITDNSAACSVEKISDIDRTSNLFSSSDSNGPLELSKGGAVSLLHPPSCSSLSQGSVNGEVDSSDYTKSKSDSVVIRSRRDSVDGSQPNASIVRLNWASGDKQTTNVTSNSSSKNIVISAINKANNTVVTKVLGPASGGKVHSNNLAARAVGNGTTSILSPRGAGQTAFKAAQGKVLPANKVISVTATQSGE